MNKLEKLRDKAYEIACNHGWHDDYHSREHWLCLVITELCEAVQADRQGKYAEPDREYFEELVETGTDQIEAFERCIKDTVEEELADAVIRLLDFAGLEKLPLMSFECTSHIARDFIEAYKKIPFTDAIYHLICMVGTAPIDVVIAAIVGLARTRKFYNLLYYVDLKMRYNEHRPYKHEKAY